MVHDFSVDNSESHDDNQASDHNKLDNDDLEGRHEIVQIGVNSEFSIGKLNKTDIDIALQSSANAVRDG